MCFGQCVGLVYPRYHCTFGTHYMIFQKSNFKQIIFLNKQIYKHIIEELFKILEYSNFEIKYSKSINYFDTCA
jgi:hypothetical protein